MSQEETGRGLNRRQLLGTTAFVAAAGATGMTAGLTLGGGLVTPAAAQGSASGRTYEVKPGELDEYYVFFSSGQTGEIRGWAPPRCAG